jgi:hypothetical protein
VIKHSRTPNRSKHRAAQPDNEDFQVHPIRRASSRVSRLVEASGNWFSGQITLRTDFFYRRSR